MSAPKAGDSFPDGVVFSWVPPSPETKDVVACGIPAKYNASKEFQDKKAVVVAVPGAFTPTCQEKHLVSYIANLDKLKAKGADVIIFISANDQWVMSAWGKANGVLDKSILFMSDDDLGLSKTFGWTNGSRALRYALIVDHGKIVYAETDVPKSTELSGAEGVLAKL